MPVTIRLLRLACSSQVKDREVVAARVAHRRFSQHDVQSEWLLVPVLSRTDVAGTTADYDGCERRLQRLVDTVNQSTEW